MLVLTLPARLLHEQADACLAQWMSQISKSDEPSVQVDAALLHEFDSSALAVLLGLRRVVKLKGQTLKVLGMPPRLQELAHLYGVAELLQAD